MLLLLCVALLITQSQKYGNCRPLQEAKKAPQSDTKSVDPDPETLEELFSNQKAVREGDILLPSNRNVVGKKWQILDIPYEISPELESRTADIQAAVAMVAEKTCVSFHRRNGSEPDYLYFKTSKGCASFVGFIGGGQPVMVAGGCGVGNLAHEVLHALGFHHEHTRLDRGGFIHIQPQNIITGMEKNFARLEGDTFDIPYDYGSVLHYGKTFFSSNGEPTIVPLAEAPDLGQRKRLSPLDVQRVRNLYGCDANKT
ncbi:hatching enzyme 1.2-like [Menidia menidia]